MQRCSHAWLLAYIPDETVAIGHNERIQADKAMAMLPDLRDEAQRVGIGLAVSTSTAPDSAIRVQSESDAWWEGVRPRRQVVDPHQLERLLWNLGATPA